MKRFFCLLIIGFLISITACSNQKKKAFVSEMETEKKEIQANIEKLLNEFGFEGNYSITVIFQKNLATKDNVEAESRIVKRVYGKEVDMMALEMNDAFNVCNISNSQISSNSGIDGFYEDSEYAALYNNNVEKTYSASETGYISSIVVVDFTDEKLISKLNAFLNFSIANTNRGDIINVVSKKDFEINKEKVGITKL